MDNSVLCQEPIVLRDLSVLSDVGIVNFDKMGINLSNGEFLTWDKVLRASVEPDKQSEFDQFLNEVGLPIFRLKSRIRKKDWAGIGEVAEPLYQSIESVESSSIEDDSIKYLVYFGTMKGRLFRGDRPGAVTPFLRAARIQKNASKGKRGAIPPLLPADEVDRMISNEILPIWFDLSKVQPAFDVLSGTFLPSSSTTEAGEVVYLASFAISLGRPRLSMDLIELIESRGGEFDEWARLLRAQLHLQQNEFGKAEQILDANSFSMPSTKSLRIYIGATPYFVTGKQEGSKKSNAKESDQVNAILTLLKVPSEYADQFPNLAAAAIYQALRLAEVIHFQKEKTILEQELLMRFPNSYHARVMENERIMRQN